MHKFEADAPTAIFNIAQHFSGKCARQRLVDVIETGGVTLIPQGLLDAWITRPNGSRGCLALRRLLWG